jgi:hypothetical protein
MLMYDVRSLRSSFTASVASGVLIINLLSVSRIVVVTMKKNSSMNTMSESEPEGGCGTSLFPFCLNFDILLFSFIF